MKHAVQTLKKCFHMKYGVLLFAGMILGLMVVIVASSGLIPSRMATFVAMVGAVISMFCGNGFAQLITILHKDHNKD